MPRSFDSVVIGAGIVGSCTAWQLAKKGQNVLLLEQFHLPNTRGSSHGQSRMIRTCYEERHFAAMMPDAFALWQEIEKDSNTTVFENTKVLFLSNDETMFNKTRQNVEEFFPGSVQNLNLQEYLNENLMRAPEDYNGFVDTSGGVLFAHKAVTAVQGLFKELGGEINDGCRVTSIDNVGDDVRVTTLKEVILAKSLVVCAGAWTSKLFNEEANQILKRLTSPVAEKVYYWKRVKDFKDLPSFLDYGISTTAYGLTSEEYPGLMKVCIHGVGPPCDPDEREKAVFDNKEEEKLKAYVKERLPMLEPTPAVIEKCIYTVSPDENFIIDSVPTYRNVYVGCGFSGTGFKTAPVVGKILSEMVLNQVPSHDVNVFALSRFDQK